MYIYEDGRKSYVSAKTRSWKQAEKFAQSERDKRDPVKAEWQKIPELRAKDEEAAAARELNQVTIEDALDRWARSRKQMSQGTVSAYRVVVRKIDEAICKPCDGRICRPCMSGRACSHADQFTFGALTDWWDD